MSQKQILGGNETQTKWTKLLDQISEELKFSQNTKTIQMLSSGYATDWRRKTNIHRVLMILRVIELQLFCAVRRMRRKYYTKQGGEGTPWKRVVWVKLNFSFKGSVSQYFDGQTNFHKMSATKTKHPGVPILYSFLSQVGGKYSNIFECELY